MNWALTYIPNDYTAMCIWDLPLLVLGYVRDTIDELWPHSCLPIRTRQFLGFGVHILDAPWIARPHPNYQVCMCYRLKWVLRPDSQLSLFQSQLAGFEAGWPASKWADPIRDKWTVMARFKTSWADSFKTGWDWCKADLYISIPPKTCM